MSRKSKQRRDFDAAAVEDLFNKLREQDSDQMAFRIEREGEPGRTFSAEGLMELNNKMALFVGARLARRFEDRPKGAIGPHRMEAEVSVRLTIDGQTMVVTEDLMPWYAISDGDRRKVH